MLLQLCATKISYSHEPQQHLKEAILIWKSSTINVDCGGQFFEVIWTYRHTFIWRCIFSELHQFPWSQKWKGASCKGQLNMRNWNQENEQRQLKQTVLWKLLKGTLMQIWKSSLIFCVHMKTIPWKFRILIPKNSRVICPWSL